MNRIKSGVTCLILIMLIAACASTNRFNFGNAETGYILAFHNGGNDTLHYEMTTSSISTSEQNGQSRESSNEQYYKYSLVPQKADSMINFIVIAEEITQSFSSAGNPRATDMSHLSGKRARVSIRPQGTLKDITAIDSLTAPADSPYRSLDQARLLSPGLFTLPAKPVKVGDTWSETKNDSVTNVDSTRGYSNTMIREERLSYKILDEEIKHGMNCLHIQVESQFTQTSFGEMMESQMSSEGDGERTSDAWFAYKEGIIVEVQIENFYEGTMAFSGQMSMTMPQSTESIRKIKLIK